MATTRTLSAEDLWIINGDEHRYELVQGELAQMAPTGGDHGSITFLFGLIVGSFVAERRLGRCYAAETGFIIDRDPDTVLAPDFAFIQSGRVVPADLHERYVPLVPALVAATRSPSSSRREAEQKMERYRACGVRLAFLIDPQQQSITVYHANVAPRILRGDDVIDGGDVLPGFRTRVSTIFDDPQSPLS